MKKIHFCCGLPRSGSTVLMNILQQNPDVFTTGTCALNKIISDLTVKSRYSESFQAMNAEDADNAMYGLIHGATQGWFQGLTNKPVVISKNRSWTLQHHLYPDSKFIVTIRDIRDVVESFDKLNRNIKALHSYGDDGKMYGCMSEDEKYHYHFNTSNAFSGALYQDLPRLMNLWKQTSGKVKFIRYEDMLANPEATLDEVYQFLDLPVYQHDLYNIEQSALYEHDHAYFREKTSHKVQRSMLKPKEPDRFLSNAVHDRILNEHQWFYDGFYPNARKST
jgi:sulfotransferase